MATHALDQLYGALLPTERARMMARINRTEAYDELRRVRDTLPGSQAHAYNHLLAILKALHTPLANDLFGLVVGAERDNARIGAVIIGACEERVRRYSLGDVWKLVPYPVTKSEYAALVALERGRLEPLAAFAWFVAQAGADDDWRPEVITVLEAEVEDEWACQRAVAALLEAAVTAGTLPTPTGTTEGPAQPWGVLCDWLGYDPPMGPACTCRWWSFWAAICMRSGTYGPTASKTRCAHCESRLPAC
jgi:hypothetical protein